MWVGLDSNFDGFFSSFYPPLLHECPNCGHYFPPGNGYAAGDRRDIPNPRLAALCIPCGDEAAAQELLDTESTPA
jgi:hypothetical protein